MCLLTVYKTQIYKTHGVVYVCSEISLPELSAMRCRDLGKELCIALIGLEEQKGDISPFTVYLLYKFLRCRNLAGDAFLGMGSFSRPALSRT